MTSVSALSDEQLTNSSTFCLSIILYLERAATSQPCASSIRQFSASDNERGSGLSRADAARVSGFVSHASLVMSMPDGTLPIISATKGQQAYARKL